MPRLMMIELDYNSCLLAHNEIGSDECSFFMFNVGHKNDATFLINKYLR